MSVVSNVDAHETADEDRQDLLIFQDNEGPQEIVPGLQKLQQPQGEQDRFGHWQSNLPVDPEIGTAIDMVDLISLWEC